MFSSISSSAASPYIIHIIRLYSAGPAAAAAAGPRGQDVHGQVRRVGHQRGGGVLRRAGIHRGHRDTHTAAGRSGTLKKLYKTYSASQAYNITQDLVFLLVS